MFQHFAVEPPPRHHDVTIPVDVTVVTFWRSAPHSVLAIGDVQIAVKNYCKIYRISQFVYILGAWL